MTPPTPTDSDKRAAKRIIGVYAEYDLEGVAQTERIIAEEMAVEREALRLAKPYVQAAIQLLENSDEKEALQAAKSALTAIEKVTG